MAFDLGTIGGPGVEVRKPKPPAKTRLQRATIDFETRSRIDLKKSGAWRYASDDSTQVMCLCYRLPFWPEGKTAVWVPDWIADICGVPRMPPPADLCKWIEDGGVVEAHNAMFERAVWRSKLVPEFWPDIPDVQWRCSAAKAASYSLPRGLEKCCEIMNLPVQKDKEGHKLMMTMCRPKKATKKQPERWVQDATSIKRLIVYCRKDVLAEERFSQSLPDLSPVEQEIWLIDQEINERGIPIDLELVDKAMETLAYLRGKYEEEIQRLTDGKVPKVTARNQLKEWMLENGFELPNTQAATLDALLEDDFLPDHIHGVVSRVRMAGRASTAKYKTIRYRASDDGRCRDVLMYAGASRTSRWAGVGIQPQNLPRGKIKNMDDTVFALMNLDAEELEEEYDDLYSVFSGALRGAILPGKDKMLVTADYSSVEARGLFWVCDHHDGVELFNQGIDSYLEMAAFVNNLDYATIKREFDEDKKNKAPSIRWADERQFGKQIILGAGYQLGPPKFIDYCAQSKIIIDLDTAKKGILGYRERHAPVKAFWYACEGAAIEAMQNPGSVVRVNSHIAYKRAGRFLFCQLPSGRLIPYPYPKLEWTERVWEDVDEVTGKVTYTKSRKLAISYMEINSFTKKWDRSYTYGGKLVENIVQALCRDLMAHAMRVVKRHGQFELLLTVHDELVTALEIVRVEALGGSKAAAQLLCDLMCHLPNWGRGFPIAAEGAAMLRYRK
jgi:DNA polymerase